MKPMNNVPGGQDEHAVIETLLKLPHKIIRHHELDVLTHIVMHEIAHHSLFGLKRALYLVDNPDFDHLKGVAGYCEKECQHHQEDLWKDPQQFKSDMHVADFHHKTQAYLGKSFKPKHINVHDFDQIVDLAHGLGLEDPHFFSWEMKHGNQGLFIFEKNKDLGVKEHNLLSNAVVFLSLCPLAY